MLAQVAGALAAAHAQGVIHRDVRPANVLCDAQSGRAVLSDFGIAGILETGSEAATRLTREGQLLGDPTHMSPEQLTGAQLTTETDVYSLGILAYELLTGEQPYRVPATAQLGFAHVQQTPRDLRDMMDGADPRLADLLLRCLAKEPRHRPSAATVAQRLEGLRDARAAPSASDDVVVGALRGLPVLASFLEELRRRRVVNVAILYLAVAFIVLQAADLVLPALPLPAWVYPVLVFLTLGAFPIVLVLGWIYDLTRSGIRRTDALEGGGRARGRLVVLQAIGLALALVFTATVAYWFIVK